jgi:hypothetical protein
MLLKIGNCVLNLDRAEAIYRQLDGDIAVVYNKEERDREGNPINAYYFDGEEGEALWSWLNTHTEKVVVWGE